MSQQDVGVPAVAEELGNVHLIGVGGIGMSGIARLLLARGLRVSGSDARQWPALDALRAMGATIHLGHDAANLADADTVIYSSAVKPGNPELDAARESGRRVLHRSQALVALMGGRRVVAVSGTNGKTTTTSMITTICQHAGVDPSFAIGGELSAADSNAHHGSGDLFVAEADESDRSFLLYSPYAALVTNIEADHLDTYGTLEAIEQAFDEFAARVVAGGFLVVCADDPGAAAMGERAAAGGVTVWRYGQAADADLVMRDLHSGPSGGRFRATLDGADLGEVRLPVPGTHIALNAAGALLTAARLDIEPRLSIEALGSYGGVRRRFELKGTAAGVRVYDDYAYHQTSITAQLRTTREVVGDGRVVVVFQPYRLSRTQAFEAEIAEALALGDEVIVMEVYGPGETREPGEGGAALTARIPLDPSSKVFVASWSEVAGVAAARAQPGDIVITMGAPPLAMMGDEVLSALSDAQHGSGAAPAHRPGAADDGEAR